MTAEVIEDSDVSGLQCWAQEFAHIGSSQVVKTVVAFAVDKEGEAIYPRKWDHDLMDMPVVEKAMQDTLSFSPEIMTGLATWRYEWERMLFILCGAAGLRRGGSAWLGN